MHVRVLLSSYLSVDHITTLNLYKKTNTIKGKYLQQYLTSYHTELLTHNIRHMKLLIH